VCDEIFGEENFIANIIWQKKYTRSNDAKWFSDNHDHILAYGKNKELVTLNGQERNEDQLKAYTNPDNHPKGPWKATPLHAKSGSN
ncbi:site-specific DNA-methyltransferase, partial [Klebsiella pneumoniae]|nr:site-specific DNA-methyltransferase [Klebsiella pneumoniae]